MALREKRSCLLSSYLIDFLENTQGLVVLFFKDFNLRSTFTYYPLACLSDTVTVWLVCLFVWKREKSIILYYHLIAYSNGSQLTN